MEANRDPFAYAGKRFILSYFRRTRDDLMKLAIDSSSFAKRYVQEIGSEKLEKLFG